MENGTKYPVIIYPADPSMTSGKRGWLPQVVVLHHTGGSGSVESQVEYLRKNDRGVSIHVVIGKDGKRYRMVTDDVIAHHVGNSSIGSIGKNEGIPVVSPNGMSLGIELVNTGSKTKVDPWPDAQVESCAEQVAEWLEKYDIEMVTSHGGIDKMGKYDPYKFPFHKFWQYVGQMIRSR